MLHTGAFGTLALLRASLLLTERFNHWVELDAFNYPARYGFEEALDSQNPDVGTPAAERSARAEMVRHALLTTLVTACFKRNL